MHGLLLQFKQKLDVLLVYKTLKKQTKMTKQQELSHLDGSERSMIPIIKYNASKIGINRKPNDIYALEEFAVGTGVSDLTIFTVDKKLIASRKKKRIAPITSRTNVELLLFLLEKGPSTVDQIASNAPIGRQTILNSLANMLRAGTVEKTDGLYMASYDIQSGVSENIVAIEAKVRNWKSGLRQAMRYKEYADYSYLAIYEDNIAASLKNIEMFKRTGIGLIGVSDSGIKIHLKASLSEAARKENKILAYERMVSVVDERFESFVAWNGFSSVR